MAGSRRRIWAAVAGGVVAALVALVLLWTWDWFIPLVDARASAALGRPVTVAHLHVLPGRVTTVMLDDVVIANPPDRPSVAGGSDRFANIHRLAVAVDVVAYIKRRAIVIPLIDVEKPVVEAIAGEDGKGNWTFPALTSPQADGATPAPSPEIGEIRISDGQAHVAIPRFKTDGPGRTPAGGQRQPAVAPHRSG